jgi:hypothetical protein
MQDYAQSRAPFNTTAECAGFSPLPLRGGPLGLAPLGEALSDLSRAQLRSDSQHGSTRLAAKGCFSPSLTLTTEFKI